VVTEEVPADALVLERSQQIVKPGWAQRFREMKLRAKGQR
jgi:bifunctional UDP-N-acetylglucosamine pyrophosphorylase / glucosamine-1-phosphate N-acetyltransferase